MALSLPRSEVLKKGYLTLDIDIVTVLHGSVLVPVVEYN